MSESQFLLLLFIQNKGHKTTGTTIHKLFENEDITYLRENNYIELKQYGKVTFYFYCTPKGKQICDSITPVLNLI